MADTVPDWAVPTQKVPDWAIPTAQSAQAAASQQGAFPRVKARLAAKGTDTQAPALRMADAALMDLVSGAAGALQRTPVVGKGLELLGKGSDWLQGLMGKPAGRDYPLQGTVEAINKGISHVPVLNELETPKVAVELAGRTLTDPLALLGPLAKSEKVAGMVSSAARAPGAAARAVGEATTGISKEALSAGSTDAGRAALKSAATSQPASGVRLSDALKTFSKNMPEKPLVNALLDQSPDIDIRPVLDAFEKAKIRPLGPMGSATPGMLKTNNAIDAYAGAVRGNLPTPEQIAAMDFGGNLDLAKAAIADPKSKWGMLNDIAKRSAAASSKADNTAARTAQGASRSAAQYGSAPKEVPTPNDPNLGGEYGAGSRGMFRGTVPNPELPTLLEKAKTAAATAREAYTDAQAKSVTGEITASDASKAKSELDRANSALHAADAANEFSQGRTLDEVSRTLLDRHQISGDALRTALEKGRMTVGNNSFTPNFEMSARDYKRLREALDRDIDHDTPEGQALDQALKGPRSVMKDQLIQHVPGDYLGTMQKWADKLSVRDELKDMIGKHEGARQDIRATNFLKAAAKEGPGGPRYELLKRFEKEAGGGGFADEAHNANLGFEFGPDGVPPLLPKGADKKIVAGLIGGGGFTAGGPLGAAATALGTSPAALTKVTIPAADAIGDLIGRGGKAASKIKNSTPIAASALMRLLGM